MTPPGRARPGDPAILPADLQPATWGVTHGSGFLGSQIRRAQLRMSRSDRFPEGDHEASWAGHCVVYVGEYPLTVGGPHVPAIVEAEWPKVKLSPATKHADVIWATGQPLTYAQREIGRAAVLAMLGQHYDPFIYPLFLGKAAGMTLTGNLGPVFLDPRIHVCSGVSAEEQRRMEVDTTALKLAATTDPNIISPADMLRWGLDAGGHAPRRLGNGWMSRPVPAWK